MVAGQEVKAKGVADIVFLMDATGSMADCIDKLKDNVANFTDTLTTPSANMVSPVRDWRAKVVGFRDFTVDSEPFVDNPFVTDPASLKDQLHRLTAVGGGDEAESLLDAVFRVANMGQTGKDAPPDSGKWRYRSSAVRVIVVFTDAPYHEAMVIPEASGGSLEDVINICHANRIVLSIFAPPDPGYDRMSAIDK
ncbi:VWA domain-containing protein, partial [Gemmatimonadota bacterium]